MARHSVRSLRRNRPRIEPKLRMLILCEGKVTEPRYFHAFKHQYRNQLIEIDVIAECGVPKTLVQQAVERKKQAEKESRKFHDPFLKYDEVWCVFDVDSHPNLAEAKNQAHDNGLKLAISNPCFELWVLLHFQDQRAYQERASVQRACRGYLPEFEKEVPFARVQPRYPDAVQRAIALQQWQTQQGRPDGNPSTGVHEVTERIVDLGKESFLSKMHA